MQSSCHIRTILERQIFSNYADFAQNSASTSGRLRSDLHQSMQFPRSKAFQPKSRRATFASGAAIFPKVRSHLTKLGTIRGERLDLPIRQMFK